MQGPVTHLLRGEFSLSSTCKSSPPSHSTRGSDTEDEEDEGEEDDDEQEELELSEFESLLLYISGPQLRLFLKGFVSL